MPREWFSSIPSGHCLLKCFLDQRITRLADNGEAIDGSDFCCGSENMFDLVG